MKFSKVDKFLSDLEAGQELYTQNYVDENNIINELEEYLNERSEYTNFGLVLDKIKELKGSDKVE